jgi:DNA-binding CsgD family transcriptional regulator
VPVRIAWPLTGRSEELSVIEAGVSDPEISGIVICGPAGVGKSRIAREALASAAAKGCEVHWAVGTSSARGLPLGAFDSWAPAAATDTLQLVRGVIESLTSAPPGTTVIVGVDDAHLLDDLSTFVLHQIVQRRAAKVVLTVRDREPISQGLHEVRTSGQLARLDLQPLSRDETAMLLSAVLGGSVDPDAVNRLWLLTRGNALYLRNILEQEVSDGRLAQQHGYWTWTGEPIVPPNLVELIESRIGTLPREVGEVIDVLAVGEPLELASLTRITDHVAVEDADARGLITLNRGATGAEVRVAHPLYGEVRRKRAAPTRLRRLRGLVATELAGSDTGDDMRMAVRRAVLSIDSDLQPDPDLLVRAAQGATWLADLALADRLADAAVRAGAGAEANIVRSRALTWLGRGEEADALLEAIDTNDLTDADRGRLTFLRASNMLWALGDPAGAKALVDGQSATTPPDSRSFLDAFLAMYWAALGKPATARQASKDLAVHQLPAIVGAEAAWAILKASGDAGRAAEADVAADAGYTISSRNFDAAQMRLTIADTHVCALLSSGRIEAAWDTAQRLCDQTADLPGAAQLLSRGVAGRAALGAGRLAAACTLLEPVVEVLSAVGVTRGLYGFAYRYQLPRVIALAIRGSVDSALAAVNALDEEKFLSWQYLDYERVLAKVWVAAAQGAVSEAITTTLSAAETAHVDGRFATEVVFLQTATQLGDHSSASRLRELEAIVEGPRVGVAARFAAALQTGDGAELAAVSEAFEEIGDGIAALDAAAHAAMAYRRKGLRGSAYGCATRAETLAEKCEGARTPAMLQVMEPLPLTYRERETVMLIGQGLSTSAIAERLHVSVRTVEGHIYRAMTKTGVTTRDELAALLPRQVRARG